MCTSPRAIVDRRLGTNLHFWRLWAHARRVHCLTSFPPPPPTHTHTPRYNVEKYYLQFLLIFNIVLGGEEEEKRVFKRKASLFSNFISKTQIIRKIT